MSSFNAVTSSPTDDYSSGKLEPISSAKTNPREDLNDRGLSDATIEHFGLHVYDRRWRYPVHPNINAYRSKAFKGASSPKYKWHPKKPPDITFYSPDGKLAQYVAEAGSVLWVASGEADVWALWEAGITNATCTFDGEAKNVPDWFVPALSELGAKEVHIAPDCDSTGLIFARKLRDALPGSGITLVIHKLPFEMGSKGDIGTLLLKVGPEKLHDELMALPLMDISSSPPRRPKPQSPNEPSELYEEWCLMVERKAVQTWSIAEQNGGEYSRKNFRCPQHDDRNPSASWNYRTHGFQCFACGEYNTLKVAEMLGLPSWKDYKPEHKDSQRPRTPKEGRQHDLGREPEDTPPFAVPHAGGDDELESGGPAYAVDEDGCMVVYLPRAKGGHVRRRICEFSVVVTECVTDELGRNTYHLTGLTIQGRSFQTTIAARDFEDHRLLKAQLSGVIGPNAAIYPDMGKHLPPAIRKLSGDVREIRSFQRTGWIDNMTIFLIPGREREDTKITLHGKLPYHMVATASLEMAASALRSLILAVGPRKSLPILAFLFQGPLAAMAGWTNERYGVFIQGRTGSFKTTWSQLAMSVYGPDFARDERIIKLGQGSTPNAVMKSRLRLMICPSLSTTISPISAEKTISSPSYITSWRVGKKTGLMLMRN